MTFEELFAVDSSNMYQLIKTFPAQVKEAVDIGRSAQIPLKSTSINCIVLCGLGGSAIGGDLLKSYLADELSVPFIVNRSYTLPRFVGPKTLVIISSYSGNTEETIAAHREAYKRRARILCISSNGEIAKLAGKKHTPVIGIPPGLPPRAALGYSFFPLLIALSKMGFIKDKRRDINETIRMLERSAEDLGIPDPATNRALQIADQLRWRLGVVYSSTERFDAVATRWRGQVAENAKSLMFGHVLPEMNHNELVGWKVLGNQMKEMRVLFLRDKSDHKRIAHRLNITKQVIAEHTPHVTEIWSEGDSLLARMFFLVYLGDWTSYYLAILHQQDPTPVLVIDHLKNELSKL